MALTRLSDEQLSALVAREEALIKLVADEGEPDGLDGEWARDVSKIFVLSRDVENPRPDRRSKDWSKLPIWKYATRFRVVVRIYKGNPAEDRRVERVKNGRELMGCYRVGARYQMLEWSDMLSEQRDALVEALVPATETLPETFERLAGGTQYDDVRAFLVWAIDAGQLGRKHAEEMFTALLRSEAS